MPRKKKEQSIETRIATKTFAKLGDEIEKILAADKKDRPIEDILNSDLATHAVWGSGGPPHMVKGQIIE
jgi:hypothetical protein